MKTLLLLAVAGAAVWFVMTRAQRNAAVPAAQKAPVEYAKSLQNDVSRAKVAADQANKAVSQAEADVRKAVDADH